MKTKEQLRRDHGTPEEFANAVWRAVGDFISVDEAKEAIAKYAREYAEAL